MLVTTSANHCIASVGVPNRPFSYTPLILHFLQDGYETHKSRGSERSVIVSCVEFIQANIMVSVRFGAS